MLNLFKGVGASQGGTYAPVGLTEQGELKVFVRDVFALLDGYMGGNENLNDNLSCSSLKSLLIKEGK